MKQTISIQYGKDAQKQMLAGVQAIAKAVKVTLGPSGKNVFIRNNSEKVGFATKDGVTVAAHIKSDIPQEQVAIELMQEVANQADALAGDGTTTATVLAEALFEMGIKYIEEHDWINLIDFKRGMDMACVKTVAKLKDMAKKCNTQAQLKQVAMIASNNDENISKIVLDAYKVSGKQGVVHIKRSRNEETFLTSISGMNLPTGFLSRYFDNTGEDRVELQKPWIYVTSKKIDDIGPVFGGVMQTIADRQESIIIVCKEMAANVLDVMVRNKIDNNVKICVCKAPSFGDEQLNELSDLTTIFNKKPFVENEMDIEQLTVETAFQAMCRSEEAMITKDRFSVKGPFGLSDEEHEIIENVKKAKADQLRIKAEEAKTEYEKSLLQMRISRLTDGLAYIHIGARSDIEFIEKQHRVQDALYAVKSASEEGIVIGGGIPLFKIGQLFKAYGFRKIIENKNSFQLGMELVYMCLDVPFWQIIENVGMEVNVELQNAILQSENIGVDARTKEAVDNMYKVGIIDPVKVTRVALENAVSIVGMLLTTDCAVIDLSAYEKQTYRMPY